MLYWKYIQFHLESCTLKWKLKWMNKSFFCFASMAALLVKRTGERDTGKLMVSAPLTSRRKTWILPPPPPPAELRSHINTYKHWEVCYIKQWKLSLYLERWLFWQGFQNYFLCFVNYCREMMVRNSYNDRGRVEGGGVIGIRCGKQTFDWEGRADVATQTRPFSLALLGANPQYYWKPLIDKRSPGLLTLSLKSNQI